MKRELKWTLIGFIHIFTLQKKYSPKRRGATLPLPPQLLPLISSVLFSLNWPVYINQERKTKRALHNVSLHTVKERDYCSKIKRQSAKAKMRSWRKKRSRRPSTFYGSPLCLPSQKPPAVDLVLLVAAHHSKRDHLLQDRKNRDRQEEQRDIPWRVK